MANFADVFAKKEDMQPTRGAYKITWISYLQLEENERQYCPGTQEEIENLADMIAGDGRVLQNLIVQKMPDQKYKIIAGHKRCAAVKYLVEERGLKDFAEVPCAVMHGDDVKMRFSLISSNAHHEKTPYETMHELQELKYLLENFPESFPHLQKGRMVERLAQQTGLKKTVVGDYQSIAKNLGDKAMTMFKNNEIDKSAALAISSLPEDEQNNLIKNGKTTHKEVKEYKQKKEVKETKEIEKITTKPILEADQNPKIDIRKKVKLKQEFDFPLDKVQHVLNNHEKKLKEWKNTNNSNIIMSEEIIIAGLQLLMDYISLVDDIA